jgi:hypothetical protein
MHGQKVWEPGTDRGCHIPYMCFNRKFGVCSADALAARCALRIGNSHSPAALMKAYLKVGVAFTTPRHSQQGEVSVVVSKKGS